jgi:hypothetical protein
VQNLTSETLASTPQEGSYVNCSLKVRAVKAKCIEYDAVGLILEQDWQCYTLYSGSCVYINGCDKLYMAGQGSMWVCRMGDGLLLSCYVGEFALGAFHGYGVLWQRDMQTGVFDVFEGLFFNNVYQVAPLAMQY